MLNKSRWTRAVASSSLAVLAAAFAWQEAAVAHEIFYKGRAIGVTGSLKAGTSSYNVKIADTLNMACSGEARDATVATASNPPPLNVKATAIKSHTVGQNNTAASDAALETLFFEVPGLKITAATVETHAEAHCNTSTGKVTLTGGGTVQELVINGQRIAVDGGANQKIELPEVGTIWVNHQTRNSSRTELTVTGLRIKLLNPSYPANGDFFVSYSRAGMNCKI